MQPVNKLYKKSCGSRLEEDIISRNCLVTCSEFNSAYLQTAHSKPRSVVNRETSTSSSCPLPLSILKSIPHVVMRTISDEEAKRAKIKIHGVKNGTGVSHKKKPHQSGENTGRWTKEEHDVFLVGLEKHGKEWKEISHMIPTRSVVQIRTHAQKYFQKVAKSRAREGKLDPKSGEHNQIVSTASSTASLSNHKRRRAAKKNCRKDANVYHKKISYMIEKKRRKRVHKKEIQITSVEDIQPITPLVIKAPRVKISSSSVASSFVEDFDDNIMGTPKSVAELFDMDITVRQPKVVSSDLPFLEEDIGNFDFDSCGSDASTDTYVSSASSSPFEQREILIANVMKSGIPVGKSIPISDAFMAFTDLDIAIDKSSFLVELGEESDEDVRNHSSTNENCYKTLNPGPCEAITEEEFISGLLA